ncbi:MULTISPECIES: MCP four helix bundle domain-containing protein [Pseudomonas]|uniref:MCP four helix bundle domain-containing protein n=1 Tax=Pseudomonas TaxID=286 RepID=UPI00257A02E2|nr:MULTISPECIES: MCP four helix bundle domain-containing protein [Pseudomonas]
MTVLRNLKLAPRSALSFGLIGLIVLLLGLCALERVHRLSVQADIIDQHWVPSLLRLEALNKTMNRAGVMTFRMVVLRNPTALRDNQAGLQQTLAEARRLQDALAQNLQQPEERSLFERYQQNAQAFGLARQAVIELAAAGKLDEAVAALNGPIDNQAPQLAISAEALGT